MNLINIPSDQYRYNKLLSHLFVMTFEYSIPLDCDRASDGINLRYRFGSENNIEHHVILEEIDIYDCSVLEMMIALSVRCEEHLIDDPDEGIHPEKWFWEMIFSMGLDFYDDEHFDIDAVNERVYKMLYRKYAPNGYGGLFTLSDPPRDLRTVEIWYQMMWYLVETLKNNY